MFHLGGDHDAVPGGPSQSDDVRGSPGKPPAPPSARPERALRTLLLHEWRREGVSFEVSAATFCKPSRIYTCEHAGCTKCGNWLSVEDFNLFMST